MKRFASFLFILLLARALAAPRPAAADSVPPGPLSDLTLDNLSPTTTGTLEATWSPPSDPDYDGAVFRFRTDGVPPQSAADGTLLSIEPATATATAWSGLQEETLYWISGFAFDSASPSPNYAAGVEDPAHPDGVKPKDLKPPGSINTVFRALAEAPEGSGLTTVDGDIYLSWIFPYDTDTKGARFRARTDGVFPVAATDGFAFGTDAIDLYPGYNYATAAIVSGLTLGTSYSISGFAYDDETPPNFDPAGRRAESGESVKPRNQDPPGDIAAFVVDRTSPEANGALDAQWTNPSDVDFAGVRFVYRTDGSFPASYQDGTLLGDVEGGPGEAATTTWSGLNEETSYSISGFAYDFAEPPNYASGTPNPTGGIKPRDLIAPEGITGLLLSNGDPAAAGEIFASWTNPATTDFKGVRFRYRTDGVYPVSAGSGIQLSDVEGVSGQTATAVFSGLTPSQQYSIAGFAYDDETAPNYGAGTETSSGTKKARDDAAPGPIVFTVVNNTQPAANGEIYASWTEPADADYAGVRFRFRTDGVHPASRDDGTPLSEAPAGVLSATWQGLDENTTYHIAGFSFDDQDSPNFSVPNASAQAALKPKDLQPPGEALDLQAYNSTAASNGAIRAEWFFPSDSDLAGIMFRFRTDGAFPQSRTDGSLLGFESGTPGAAGAAEWDGLTEGAKYWISAFAFDDEGTANYSAGAQAERAVAPKDSNPPAALTDFSLDNVSPSQNGGLYATWTNPPDADLAGVTVRYRTDGVFPQSATDGVLLENAVGNPGQSMSLEWSGLDEETPLYLSAFAYDGQDQPNRSTGAEGPPGVKPRDLAPPGAPSGFDSDVESPTQDGQIVLLWTQPSDPDLAGLRIVFATGAEWPAGPEDGATVFDSTATPGEATQTLISGLDSSPAYRFAAYAYDDETPPNYAEPAQLTGPVRVKDLKAPPPVSGLTLNNRDPENNGEFLVSWSNPPDADLSGVLFAYRTDGAFPQNASDGVFVAHVPAVPGADASTLLSGLDEETEYAVAAFALDDRTPPNIDAQGATPSLLMRPRDLVVPEPLENLTATIVGASETGEMFLSWTNPSTQDFTGAQFRYATGGPPLTDVSQGEFLDLIAGEPGATGGLHLMGLDENAAYSIYGFSFDDEVEPNYGAGVSAGPVKPLDLKAPGEALNFVLSNGEELNPGEILAAWTSPEDVDLTEAELRFRTDGQFPQDEADGDLWLRISTAPGAEESVLFDGLNASQTYWIALFLFDDETPENGSGPWTTGVGVAPANPSSGGAPGPLKNFRADGDAPTGHGEILLSWTNPSDLDYSGALIRYRTDGQFPYNPSDGIQITDEPGSPDQEQSVTLIGLDDALTYRFSAFPYDASNPPHVRQTPTTAADGVKPKDLEPPPPVSGVKAVFTDRLVKLTWNNPSAGDFSHVQVHRLTGSVFPSSPSEGLKVYSGTDGEFTDAAVTNGLKYAYSLFAFDEAGNWSSRATASGSPSEALLSLSDGWNLAGISINPLPPDPSSVFPDAALVAAYDGERFLFAPEDFNQLAPGKAYWVYLEEAPDGYAPGGSALTGGIFFTSAVQGWHAFSNPYSKSIALDEGFFYYCNGQEYAPAALPEAIGSGAVYRYDPGKEKYVRETDFLQPWTGHFTYTSERCVLKMLNPQ